MICWRELCARKMSPKWRRARDAPGAHRRPIDGRNRARTSDASARIISGRLGRRPQSPTTCEFKFEYSINSFSCTTNLNSLPGWLGGLAGRRIKRHRSAHCPIRATQPVLVAACTMLFVGARPKWLADGSGRKSAKINGRPEEADKRLGPAPDQEESCLGTRYLSGLSSPAARALPLASHRPGGA